MAKQKVKLSRERQANTYVETWQASNVLLDKAKKDPEGSYYQLMASLIFTAFTLEAYLNHIGQRIFKCWNDLEQLSPSRKLNVIAEKLQVEKDDGKRPFQKVSELFKFRNDVAHGKSVPVKDEVETAVADETVDDFMRKRPETAWEKYCTLQNVERARVDVESIMERLHRASDTSGPLFPPDTWSGSATSLLRNQQNLQ